MLLWTAGVAGLILCAIVLWNYFNFRERLSAEAQDRARFLAAGSADQIDARLGPLQGIIEGMALTLGMQALDLPESRVRALQEALLRANPEVYGTAVAVLPALRPADWTVLSPYVYRDGDRLGHQDLGDGDAGYLGQDWFALPHYLGRANWSEPYIENTGVKMVTYSAPILIPTADGPLFAGVVTCDIELGWLDSIMAELPLGEAGYGVLLSKNGTYISHPRPDIAFNESVFSIAEARNDAGLRGVGQAMVSGEPGLLSWISWATNDPSWLAWHPLDTADWTVGTLVSKAALNKEILELTKVEAMTGLGGLLLLVISVWLVARSITRPISALSAAAPQLSSGNLDTALPTPQGDDEVAQLTTAFGTMRDNLKRYISDLAETTAARERINGELRIAHDIQMDLVPKTFPPFPDRPDMDLYAIMEPAREVGGDFYDFFQLDADRLVLAIADVSGKGVPAALFMAVTRSFLRSEFKVDADPGRVLQRVNDELADGNDACMFATLFCAVIRLADGHVDYANAGHNPPLRLQTDGEIGWIDKPCGTALGPLPDMTYSTGHLILQPGEALLLYTDGVTEAMDPSGALYGTGRLASQMQGCNDLGCERCLHALLADIREHAADADQSDDITMVMFRRLASQS
ncbi:SpoIIE family protein phosphatase [Thiohalocapsa marina]|nr:SpoIIE family protein phosphatase [Thiohalocapsa marina]